MEAIIGIVVGALVGAIVGALLMKFRHGSESAAVRANLETANERLSDAEQSASDLRNEVEDWRTRADDHEKTVVQLRERFDAAQSRYEQMEQANASLEATVTMRQSEAVESDKARAELQAKLDAANKQLAERADIEKVLGDQFKVMANEAISSNNDAFVKAADEKIGAMVKPLSEELKRIEKSAANRREASSSSWNRLSRTTLPSLKRRAT